MIFNKSKPVLFEIEKIKQHVDSLGSEKDKLNYFIDLREEYFLVCFCFNDEAISSYLYEMKLKHKYEYLPYNAESDIYQTHVSRSGYIRFLRLINDTLLPYVISELKKMVDNYEEEKSMITFDFPVFNFDISKVINYSDTLKENKIDYLEKILRDRAYYIKRECDKDLFLNYQYELSNDPFTIAIEKKMYDMKRYPELMSAVPPVEKRNKKSRKSIMKVKIDPGLCNFDIEKIREKVKSMNTPREQLLFVEYVRKEASHNKNNFNDENVYDELIKFLNIEISFYYKAVRMSSLPANVNIEAPLIKDPVRFHWQDDNTLIPYLIKLLYDEGFISPADWENRKEFIEQSFFKKNGGIFKANEVPAVEQGIELNKNSKPQKSFKDERVMKKLISKREEIKKRSEPRSKK